MGNKILLFLMFFSTSCFANSADDIDRDVELVRKAAIFAVDSLTFREFDLYGTTFYKAYMGIVEIIKDVDGLFRLEKNVRYYRTIMNEGVCGVVISEPMIDKKNISRVRISGCHQHDNLISMDISVDVKIEND